ncbi:phosphoribosyltransferase [Streptomyces sp. NPDC057623]|uniref:phosphoribosyltransferase n=1 Tax=Streptomyces sp. NPDC057623 TaxID=3346187 RepID=UPI0036862477
MRFRDREEAGRELAEQLRIRRDKGTLPHPVVLALPRGGVAVAREIAATLRAPLDVLVVRKIGAPFHEEFGVGALAGDAPPLFDEQTLFRLGLSEADLAAVVERERKELRRREERYRQGRPPPRLRDRTAVVVDDGVATGSTARVALRAVRGQDPGRLVLAVPVCAPETAEELRRLVDDFVCLHQPRLFSSVGEWYEDFGQLTDADVLAALSGGGESR